MKLKIYTDYLEYCNHQKSYFKPLLNLNFYININYRLSNLFYRIKLYPLAKLFWLVNRLLLNVDISEKCKLAGGLRIMHGLGIIIGGKVISEGHLIIYQNVTLGGAGGKKAVYQGQTISQPLLKNNVTIYSGACVIGPVICNENSQIGANAVITKNVDQNSVVIGNNTVISKEVC